MLLNSRPLNSTPLNAVGVQALVVIADPAICTASCNTGTVLQGTITVTPNPAVCTASVPNPNAGLGFLPHISPSYGVGTGEDRITPHVGFTLPQDEQTYGEGSGSDELDLKLGIRHIPHAPTYGEGEGQTGRIIFGVLAEVTTGYGSGTGQNLITPKIGFTMPPQETLYGEGEGQQIGTTLDDIVLHLSVTDIASCSIYNAAAASLIIDTDPAYCFAHTHDPDVTYSSAVLDVKANAIALAYPYYGAPILGTITIPTLNVYTEAWVKEYVVVTEAASDTVELGPLSALAIASAGIYAVNDDVTYRPAPAVAEAWVSDPDVWYGNLTPIVAPAIAKAWVAGEPYFTTATITPDPAIAIARASDPGIATTTATVPKISVEAIASTHDPVVTLGSIVPPPVFTKSYDYAAANTGAVILWSITITGLAATATAQTSEPVVTWSTADLPKISATAIASAPDPTVLIEDIEHTTITLDPAVAIASFTGIAVSEALTVDLMGSMTPAVCYIGDHIVLLGSVDLPLLSAETEAAVEYNKDLMVDQLQKTYRAPPYYQIILDRTSAGYTRLEGTDSQPMPEVYEVKPVMHITDELLALHRSGNIRIRGLLDLSQKLSYAMVNLTGSITDGTVGPVTDWAAVNKAVAELAQQQNMILAEINELTQALERQQDKMARVLGDMDNSIPGAVIPSDLSKNMEVTILVQDKRF